MEFPRTIDKPELAAALGIYKASGTYSKYLLYQKYVSKELLVQMNVSLVEFKKIRLFSFEQTKTLINYFGFTPNDFNKNTS